MKKKGNRSTLTAVTRVCTYTYVPAGGPWLTGRDAGADASKNRAVGYRYGFNGKEEDRTWAGSAGLVQDYGFRLYSPALARFLTTDPLAGTYPMLTPYQFASNRPIDGIGLEFLDSKESMMEFSGGETKLDLANASNFTRSIATSAPGVVRFDGNGPYLTTTFPLTLARTNFDRALLNSSKQGMPRESPGIVGRVSDSRPGGGNAAQRRQWRRSVERVGYTPGGSYSTPGPGGTGSKPLGGLLVVAEALDLTRSYMILGDIRTAQTQLADYGQPIMAAIRSQLELPQSESLIPENARDPRDLEEIANYMLDGTFSDPNRLEGSKKKYLQDIATQLFDSITKPEVGSLPLEVPSSDLETSDDDDGS